jgi:hypothetical protein
MLKAAETYFPGIRDHIQGIEIAASVTHMRYLGTPTGSIYGFENFLKDSELFIPNQAHIHGLYCAGPKYYPVKCISRRHHWCGRLTGSSGMCMPVFRIRSKILKLCYKGDLYAVLLKRNC